MNVYKKLAVASLISVASMAASASTINVGGVTWDPDYNDPTPPPAADLIMKYSFDQWFVDAADAGTYDPFAAIDPFSVTDGDELQGSGRVTEFNGLLDPALGGTGFCLSCELTFEFGGLLADGAGGFHTGGFFKFYVETGADIDGDYTEGAGPLWLELAVDNVSFSSGGPVGGLYTSGHVDVEFSAVGGMAMANFDTDSVNGSDIAYAADALFDGLYANGTGDAKGNTVPEPSTLAVLGLGLLGLMASRRKKIS